MSQTYPPALGDDADDRHEGGSASDGARDAGAHEVPTRASGPPSSSPDATASSPSTPSPSDQPIWMQGSGQASGTQTPQPDGQQQYGQPHPSSAPQEPYPTQYDTPPQYGYGQAPYRQASYGQQPGAQTPSDSQTPYGQQPPPYDQTQQPPYGQTPYGQQQQPYGQYGPQSYGQSPNGQQPYGQQPTASYYYGQQRKSRVAAGLFGIFLGAFGVHNFYLGYTGKAVAQLLITVLSIGLLSWVSAIWGLVEGILFLTQKTGQYSVDARGVPLE